MSLGWSGRTGRVGVFLLLSLVALPLTAHAQDGARAWTSDRALFVPMYASFAVLQGLDVHSTQRALGGGATEANPVMAGVAGKPAAFIAVKAASGAGVIYLTEKVRKRSKVGAVIVMAAVNSMYATVVAKNYRAIPR